ncbi:MAG: hypothetical protein J1E61_02125 [Lachnospiraceae bacterium]|nr:hypothetical protein [Lachnospiraceae bacterium]
MAKTISRDEKLQQILQLREYQENNTSHVNAMAGIAEGDSYDGEGEQDHDQAGLSGSFYGKLRLILCLVIFAVLFIGKQTTGADEFTIIDDLKEVFSVDYSHNVIDFVQDFTYTLEYEETSTK